MRHENIRISLAFGKARDRVVEGTGYTVAGKLFTVPEFNDPPVTLAELTLTNVAYTSALAELVNGGKLATSIKNDWRATLTDQLRKLAYYVQMRCGSDMSLLLASGFEPVSTSRARVPLPQPSVLRIEPGMAGQMVLAAEPNPNVRSWQVEHALVEEDGTIGPWILGEPSTDSRRIVVYNLIPGRLTAFRLRSIGGSTGYSDWSNTITLRAA